MSSQEVATIVADLSAQRALLVGIRPSPAAESAWAGAVPEDVVRSRHMTQTLDISRGFDDVWNNGFASSVRSHCRKAERRGVTAERDDTGGSCRSSMPCTAGR